MKLVKTQDPQKRGITLEAISIDDYSTKGWAYKSYFGSDSERYERCTNNIDGRVQWFRLDDSE